MTGSALGIFALVLFVAAYSLVILEEQLHLRKSKPVMLAAGIIWVLVAIAFNKAGRPDAAHQAIMHNLVEYAELMLFLLAAMTYINAMEERNVFQSLRSWLVSRGFSLRVIFWLTGLLAFLISPIADNLTTALLMGAVVMAVGGANQRFVVMACINVVVGANAGGAFSPFGDITTLMVWQKGMGSVPRILRPVPACTGELAGSCCHYELHDQQGKAAGHGRERSHETRRQARHVPVFVHHCNCGFVPQFSTSAAGYRDDAGSRLSRAFLLLRQEA